MFARLALFSCTIATIAYLLTPNTTITSLNRATTGLQGIHHFLQPNNRTLTSMTSNVHRVVALPAGKSRTVVKDVLSIETPEGAGAIVRRSIGTAGLRNLTPFLMLGTLFPLWPDDSY